MKIGFLFAGQGSQAVGMGRALYDSVPSARRVFDEAELDFDLKELCFGPAEKLNQTAFTQPAWWLWLPPRPRRSPSMGLNRILRR